MNNKELEKTNGKSLLLDKIDETLGELIQVREEFDELEEISGNSITQEWGIDDELSSLSSDVGSYKEELSKLLGHLDTALMHEGITDIWDYIERNKNLCRYQMEYLKEVDIA